MCKAVKFLISLIFIILVLPSQAHSVDRIVALFDNTADTVGLGDYESIEFTVKNLEDTFVVTDVYVGSDDDQIRNWIWFGNEKFANNRTMRTVKIEPHDERIFTVTVFGGKTGSYEIFVGPDGMDTTKAYGFKTVSVVRTRDMGLFSRSPGVTLLGLAMCVFGSLILLIRKGNGYRRNLKGR